MSVGSQVAPGTPCAPCKAKGHFCPAYDIVGGRAVCVHCLDDVDCPRTPRNGAHSAAAAVPARPAASRPKMVTVTAPAARATVFEEHPLRPGIAVRAVEPKPDPQPDLKPLPKPELKPEPEPVCVAELRGPRKPFGRQKCKACGQAPHVGPCQCMHRCGRPPHRGNCKGRVPARPNVAADVKHPVVQAEAQVEKSKEIFGELEAEHAVFSPREAAAVAKRAERMTKLTGTKVENDVAGVAAPALSAKSIAAGYELVALDDVPGRRPLSVYEGIVDDLAKLPVNAPVKRVLANKGIAHTFMCGITRVARTRGLKVSQVQDGATIYVWLREKAAKQ